MATQFLVSKVDPWKETKKHVPTVFTHWICGLEIKEARATPQDYDMVVYNNTDKYGHAHFTAMFEGDTVNYIGIKGSEFDDQN